MSKKYNIEKLREYAQERGGDCLSENYIGNEGLYRWVCDKGHEFDRMWISVKRGYWCHFCKFGDLGMLQKYAKNKGAECLSKTYKNCSQKYEWKCENGHIFKKSWSDIKRGKWCKQCTSDSITDLQSHAEKKGGKCLSEEYSKSDTKYEWECERGHKWFAKWLNVKHNDTWCPHCGKWLKEDIDKIAEERGGKCLMRIRGVGANGFFLWECEKGHQWETKLGNVVYNNTWCAECQKLTIGEMQKIAEERGGKCLSEKYINKRTKLKWQCAKGHIWKARPGGVKHNESWCFQCNVVDSKRFELKDVQKYVAKYGGKCLDDEYKNSETPMRFECKYGHRWKAIFNNIYRGGWCRKCHLRKRRNKAIEGICQFVNDQGGKIISSLNEIRNDDKQLKRCVVSIQCKYKHVWTHTLESLSNGTWCPHCRYKSEGKCREILEKIMGLSFPKRRLKCMEKLELDGYCKELSVAFEYDGLQHFEYIPFFHRNGEGDFHKQQARDQRKDLLCEKNRIQLLRIPSIYTYNEPKKLERFIRDWLLENEYLLIL